jgi:hypothetical protein
MNSSGEFNAGAMAAFKQAVISCPERDLAKHAVEEVVSILGEASALKNLVD